MANATFTRMQRLARRSPGYLGRRLAQEAFREADRALLEAARRERGPLATSRLIFEQGPVESTRSNVAGLGAWADAARHARERPDLRRRIVERAERAARGEVELFGSTPLALSRPFPWTDDPIAGYRFPDGFHRRLDYRVIEKHCDVKVPWELSRLRPLVELGQGHAVTGDVAWRTTALADLDSWIGANPVGFSVNWTVAMEVALRAVNLICLDGLLVTSNASDDDRRPLVAALRQHGWFLVRNLELGDINGNHFLADAVGLIWLGRYLSGQGQAEQWLERGRQMVRQAAVEQVLPDGLDHEGSVPYHTLVLELFLLALAVEPSLGDAVAGPTRRMTDALCAVVGPYGRVPDLGDDDGGRAAALSDTASRDARRVLALAAVLLDHPVAAQKAGDHLPAWEEALWLRGPVAVDSTRAAARPGPEPPHHLDAGGIVILGGGADRVVVDVGPVGFRGRGGHGHLDAMSFEAVLGARLVVRDSGTGSYTGAAALREHLRGAAAHSVVIVDDLSYALLGGIEFLWSIDGDSPPRVIELEGDSAGHRLVAEQRLPAAAGEATWRRILEWRPGQLRCRDEVRAPRSARVRHHLQLAPGAAMPSDLQLPPQAVTSVTDVVWSEGYGLVGHAPRWVAEYGQESTVEVVAFTLRAESEYSEA